MRLGDRLALGRGEGVGVEDVALGVGLEERDGLVLAVEVHQHFAEGSEDAHGGRAAVDPGAGASLGADLAPDDDPLLVHVEAERLDATLQRLGKLLERALDDRPPGAGADHAAVPAAAEQEARARRRGSTCRRRSRR